jgi:hypothetical protein
MLAGPYVDKERLGNRIINTSLKNDKLDGEENLSSSSARVCVDLPLWQ